MGLIRIYLSSLAGEHGLNLLQCYNLLPYITYLLRCVKRITTSSVMKKNLILFLSITSMNSKETGQHDVMGLIEENLFGENLIMCCQDQT